MKIKGIVKEIILTFLITLVVGIVVTLLKNLFIDKQGAMVDWGTSFIFAIIFGIALPIVRTKHK